MAEVLTTRDFDVAGVREAPEGEVLGYVIREELGPGLISEYVHPFTPQCLISDSTPLVDLLGVLGRRPYSFVLVGPLVNGIVTRADLDKPPLRTYLFALVSLLEMHVTFWIADHYGDDWVTELKPGRVSEARALQEARRQVGEELPLLHCLQFCDKRDLLLRATDILDLLQIDSKKYFGQTLRRAEKLRNTLAHSNAKIANGDSWTEVIPLIEALERLVHISDDAVEARAIRSAIDAGEGALWSMI